MTIIRIEGLKITMRPCDAIFPAEALFEQAQKIWIVLRNHKLAISTAEVALDVIGNVDPELAGDIAAQIAIWQQDRTA